MDNLRASLAAVPATCRYRNSHLVGGFVILLLLSIVVMQLVVRLEGLIDNKDQFHDVVNVVTGSILCVIMEFIYLLLWLKWDKGMRQRNTGNLLDTESGVDTEVNPKPSEAALAEGNNLPASSASAVTTADSVPSRSSEETANSSETVTVDTTPGTTTPMEGESGTQSSAAKAAANFVEYSINKAVGTPLNINKDNEQGSINPANVSTAHTPTASGPPPVDS